MPDDHLAYLQVCGENADQDIEVGRLAIALFSADHQGISVNRYHTHLKKIFDEVSERHAALIEQGSDNDVYTQLAAMKHVLSDLYGYAADTPHHEVLESADLMRVIDRGKGCSSALCLLYMDVARKMGWRIEGLNFPSRFLCRLEMNGLRLIFDPSNGCAVLQAHDLRNLVKEALGEAGELSSHYMEGLDARASLVHMCNLIKSRRIEMGEYAAALDMIERLRSFAPQEYRLLLDAGVLYARIKQENEAIKCLNEYIERAPLQDRNEALQLLNALQSDQS